MRHISNLEVMISGDQRSHVEHVAPAGISPGYHAVGFMLDDPSSLDAKVMS